MLSRFTPVGTEAIATLREVALMRRDLFRVLPKAQAGDDVVVLVHGFMASAGVFRPMRARLEKDAGARVASFSHAPGLGVRRIAQQLADLVDRIPKGTRIHLVGHSIGGLIARWYVQEMNGHERVAQTISLATPFRGTRLARLQLLIGKDLHVESTLLDRIRERAHAYDVPHTSILGTHDLIVQPFESGHFHHGESVILEGRGHNTLLFDDEAIERVVKCVRTSRQT